MEPLSRFPLQNKQTLCHLLRYESREIRDWKRFVWILHTLSIKNDAAQVLVCLVEFMVLERQRGCYCSQQQSVGNKVVVVVAATNFILGAAQPPPTQPVFHVRQRQWQWEQSLEGNVRSFRHDL
jgi:hypothetical protein